MTDYDIFSNPITQDIEHDFLIESSLKCNWFIFYTAPRAEKFVYQELLKKKYEVFLPMAKTLRIWKNRQKKIIDQVLFPSYIFVKTEEFELHTIKQIPKIVTYIHCAGKPSIIRQKDIECIKTMLQLNQEVTVEENFSEGEQVKVLYGPLAGHSGILVKQKGKTRFGIKLEDINQTFFIDICTSMLEKVENIKF
ncbi:MAG: UpxY family transcription antiterminator [Bacteroidales bacterium]|nr:UpxY family transcription antiterminator [Bacteroidales bacterium]